MAGKRKSKAKGGKKRVDEYKLRRDLREQSRRMEMDMDEDAVSRKMAEEIMEPPEDVRIGGIEGGSTQSTLVIIDGQGTPLTEVKGPDTNHWGLGMVETAARIDAMVQRGKTALGIPELVPLHCLGLSLSGCEEEKTNRELEEILRQNYPNIAKDYIITSDTLGSLRTAVKNGGIVLIAGTGSNALMINPDGEMIGCGGWGHIMGDEGSAYSIAYRACKYVFDDLDGLVQAPRLIHYVWPAMRNYFNVLDRKGMLTHIYDQFDKSKFAGFAKEIVTGCEKGDQLCLYLLRETGQLLGKHVVALSKKAHSDIKLARGGLKVICVGSVWKSWEFMKHGFMDEIHDSGVVDELSLLHLAVSSAIGASYLAAEKINRIIDKTYDKNVEIFYHYKRDNYTKTEDTIETVVVVSCNKNMT